MLKMILKIATMDSKATTNMLRNNLNNLPEAITTVKSDIELFHKYVYEYFAQLNGRGEKFNDLVPALFDTYRHVADIGFVRYMTNLDDDYHNNHNNMGDTIDVDLRTKAKEKFNILRTLKTWGSKFVADQKIIAMSSEISNLKGRLAPSSKGPQKSMSDKKRAATGGVKLKNKKSGFNKSQ